MSGVLLYLRPCSRTGALFYLHIGYNKFMSKTSVGIGLFILLLLAGGCTFNTDKIASWFSSQRLARLKNQSQALCSNKDYKTRYKTTAAVLPEEITSNLEDTWLGGQIITLNDDSYIKFSAAVWWENCKNRSYSTIQQQPDGTTKTIYHSACNAYFYSDNPEHTGYYKYYPNGTTDSPDILVSPTEIFYMFTRQDIENISGNDILLLLNPELFFDYDRKITIPGDFESNNYSALDQIDDLTCLEGLTITAIHPHTAYPSTGKPRRAAFLTSFVPGIIPTTYPVLNLTPLSKLTNLRILYLNNIRTNTRAARDYDFLEKLAKLQVLYMQDTDTERIGFIDNFANLRLLDLSWSQSIEQIAPVLWSPKLEKLYLRFMPEIDLSTTASIGFDENDKLQIKERPFPKLKDLSLEGTSVGRIDSLATAATLRNLDLSAGICAAYTGGDDIIVDRMLCRLVEINQGPFYKMDRLKQLDISGRYITKDDCADLIKILPTTKVTCESDPRAKQKDNTTLP